MGLQCSVNVCCRLLYPALCSLKDSFMLLAAFKINFSLYGFWIKKKCIQLICVIFYKTLVWYINGFGLIFKSFVISSIDTEALHQQ